jgi:hypothetical protein
MNLVRRDAGAKVVLARAAFQIAESSGIDFSAHAEQGTENYGQPVESSLLC